MKKTNQGKDSGMIGEVSPIRKTGQERPFWHSGLWADTWLQPESNDIKGNWGWQPPFPPAYNSWNPGASQGLCYKLKPRKWRGPGPRGTLSKWGHQMNKQILSSQRRIAVISRGSIRGLETSGSPGEEASPQRQGRRGWWSGRASWRRWGCVLWRTEERACARTYRWLL